MLDRKLLHRLVAKFTDEIDGDWLVFGGTVPCLVGLDGRPTMDVDIAALGTTTNLESIKIMELCENLNLPIETINQAGGFFLNRIPDWRDHVVAFKTGRKGRIFRPDIELYLQLKSQRMSESDLQDCVLYLEWSLAEKEIKSLEGLKKMLKEQIKLSKNSEVKKRLQELLSRV